MMTTVTSSTPQAGEVERLTAQLLWEACRHDPRPEVVRALIAGSPDMNLAAAAAVEHRIAALFWRALEQADAIEALGESLSSIRALNDVYRMESQFLLPQAVARAIGPLTALGLEPVVLKGPVLAMRYPDLGLRPMEDIDLLLPRADHERAVPALLAAGWVEARSQTHDVYDTVFTNPAVPSFALELHFGFESGSQRVTTLDPVKMWRTRKPIDCLGTAAYTLPLEEELVYLSAHAGKPHHAFVRLIWIADLATVVTTTSESGKPVDWDRVRAIADAGSCRSVVAAALALARHAGVESPSELFPLPERGWRGKAVSRLIDVSWPLSHLELPGYHLNYALTDTRRFRLRILLVLLASGHSIGKRFWALVDAPTRRWEQWRRARARRMASR